MRSVYICLIVLFCVLPVQLLQAADGGTDTAVAHFASDSNKKGKDRYVHVWQGGIPTEELEEVLREINAELSKNKMPDLHIAIGAIGSRGRHTLIDAASVNPQKELTRKQLLSQHEKIKKNTQAFGQWIITQVDGDQDMVVRLNVVAEQSWSDGVLTSKYVIEPFFSCPVHDGKTIIAGERVSFITKELEHFAHGANVTDQKSFDAEVGKLLKRIQHGLMGKLQPETTWALANTISYDQVQDKPWFKDVQKRIEAGKPKENTALVSGASRVYDLSDILTNGERTSINLLLDYINEKLKDGLDLGNLGGNLSDGMKRKLEEINVMITDFRMPSEQMQAIQDWMADHAGKAVIWMHFDEDKLMYEFRAGTNRLLKDICALEKTGLFIANTTVNQFVYDITSVYAATVNYFVPGKVTPLPPDYVTKYPFFQSFSITVPGIPETWYNPDVEGYTGKYADYLFNNDWRKFQRIPMNMLEEWLTGVKWPADIDTRKYSIDRQHFALLCGFINMIPDMLNGALNLPKGAISINELLCSPEQMEKLVQALESLNQQAKELGGYGKLAGELIDNIHINPCMASYYTGNMCAMLLMSAVAAGNLGRISNLASLITEIGNLDPAGVVMNVFLSPVGKFVKFAVAKTIGLWRLGKYVGKYVYQNGRYVFRLAVVEGKNLMEELRNVEWRSIRDVFEPLDWIAAEGPNGEPLEIAYFSQSNGGTGGKRGSGGKKPKVTDEFPEQGPKGSAPDAKASKVEDRIGMAEDPETGEKEPVIIKARGRKKVSITESDRIRLASKQKKYVQVPLYAEDGEVAGYLGRQYQGAEVGYFYINKDVPMVTAPEARAMYFSPNAKNALPNGGEGYILVVFTASDGVRNEISSLETEIIDNMLKAFPGKEADNLFLVWPGEHIDFQKTQQEQLTKVLTEKYGYNKPELRTIGESEFFVFSKPPASPINVSRLELLTTGPADKNIFFLGPPHTGEPKLRVNKVPFGDEGKELGFSYMDLRGEEKIIDATESSLYNTYFYLDQEYDLSAFGINKHIDAIRIRADGMPARFEQELPGTMAAVRDEALAYYKQGQATVEGIILDLNTAHGMKPFDVIAYETARKQGGVEKAIWATSTGQWAHKNGFTKAVAVTYEGPDPDQIAYVVFLKEEAAGSHGFGPDDAGSGGNNDIINIKPGNPGPSAAGSSNGADNLADPSFTQGEIRAPRNESPSSRRAPETKKADDILPIRSDNVRGNLLIYIDEENNILPEITYAYQDVKGKLIKDEEFKYRLTDFTHEPDEVRAVLAGKKGLVFSELYTRPEMHADAIALQQFILDDASARLAKRGEIAGVRVKLMNFGKMEPPGLPAYTIESPSLTAYKKAVNYQDLGNKKMLEEAALQTPIAKRLKEKFGFDKVFIVQGDQEDFLNGPANDLYEATFVFYK